VYPYDGETTITSAFVQPTEVYGETIRPQVSAAATLIAVSKVDAVMWKVGDFREVMSASAALAIWYAEQLELRLTRRYLMRHIANWPALAQYAYLLWSMAEPLADGKMLMRWKISQQMMADILGIAREEVSRRLKLLTEHGYVNKVDEGLELSPSCAVLFSPEMGGTELPSQLPILTVWSDFSRLG
jgi:CRP-like cAMP-binding protein